MVGLGDLQGWSQKLNGCKKFHCVARVLFHFHPFLITQFAGFEQNRIGNPHFADIVQERAPAHIHQLFGGKTQSLTQLNGHRRHPARVAFRFFVAQVERSGPAFDRRVVGRTQIEIALLELLEQLGIFNGDGRLAD